VSLDEIGLAQGTDKASHGHDYLRVYEPLIPADVPVKLLEVGWYEGASMRTWREYLHPESIVVGVDINQPADPVDGVHFRKVDATSGEIERVADEFGPFDVIVDDGSHLSRHVIQTLLLLWEEVAPGGLYIIEDLHVSYHKDWQGWDPTDPQQKRQLGMASSMEFLKKVADDVHFGHAGAGPAHRHMVDVASLAFHPGVAILRKKVA
jgi:hypothetical protein